MAGHRRRKAYCLDRSVAVMAEPKMSFRGKFGYWYRFSMRATDVAGNTEVEPNQPGAVTIVGQPPTISAGVQMVSVPVQKEEADPKPKKMSAGDRAPALHWRQKSVKVGRRLCPAPTFLSPQNGHSHCKFIIAE